MKTEEELEDDMVIGSVKNAATLLPPSPVISSWGQRSVFRDAAFPRSVSRLQSGPLPNGDVYIYDISTQRRGRSLPWDAGNDLFFFFFSASHVFPQTNCGEAEANDRAE